MSTTTPTLDLADLEERFADNPLDIGLLKDLADGYYSRGLLSARTQTIYEKAAMAAPREPRYASALNLCVFLRQLRRFTVEAADPELIDQEGLSGVIVLMQDYLKDIPNSPDLFFALGDLHLMRGNILFAIGAYENAVKHGFPDQRLIVRSYELASRLHTFQPSEKAYFAKLYRNLGLTEQAMHLYRGVVANGFQDPEIVHALTELLEQAADTESNINAQNQLIMDITEMHLLIGDTSAALRAFERVRFPVNQNYALVKRIAGLLIEMQDYRRAFDYLSKIPVDEENKQLLNRITVELEKIGELDTAVYLLQFINDNDLVIKEAKALREKEMEIHTELAVAELNFSNRRYDLALANYTKVLRLGYKEDAFVLAKIVELLPLVKQDHLDDLHFIAQYYLNKQDFYRASQFYDLILERRQDDPIARDKLRIVYDAILERNPNLPELRLRSGDLYLACEQIDSAIAEYKHASQFPETNVEATRCLAVAYMKRRSFTPAVEAFQAMPVSEMDLENLYDLHLIMVDRKRLAEALSLLRTIADVDDSYRDVTERIAMLRTQFSEGTNQLGIDAKMRDLIGDMAIGRYKYVEKIGSGGMGVVHKVIDNKLGKAVAMKILREGLANSSKAIERFFREARIAATLNHRNIVNIYDYNINQQTHQSYISMEYVEGPSLRELFEEYFVNPSRSFQERIKEALYYTSQICDALHVTHSKGIIHRDIKPDNILVGKDHVAKITDFGIVHIEEATFTPTGAVIGTPRYMAPEQVQGGKLDGRADLYSAGIILYEWLLGMPPFISGDIAYQQVNMPPSPPREHNDAVPAELSDIIMKCLEKNPADRFQSARDLKYALDALFRKIAPEGMPFGKVAEATLPEEDNDLDTVY
ncbi:MAG: protein kinase domain-containing protein [Candidatus Sumerlaeaceae bacterium]